YARILSIAGEPFFVLRGQRDAVDALRVGYLAHEFPFLHVHDLNTVGAGDVQPASVGIHRQVIPAAFASEFDFLDDLVGGVFRLGGNAEPSYKEDEQRGDGPGADASHVQSFPKEVWGDDAEIKPREMKKEARKNRLVDAAAAGSDGRRAGKSLCAYAMCCG